MTESADEGVENPAVRTAVEAFVAAPSQQAGTEVLRRCMHGDLLLDVTGSDLRMSDDGTSLEAGSTIRIATTQDPDGGTALVAFTSQAEIARTRSAAAQTQSMVQSGTDVLAMVQSHDHQWLYLDPAGPACALSRAEVDFALSVAHNDAVRDAVSVVDDEASRRSALIDALRADGPLLVAVDPGPQADDPDTVHAGELTELSELTELTELADDTAVLTRTSTLPDGRTALLVFTSGPELGAQCPGDSIVTLSTAEVMDMLRAGSYAGLIINPAGPRAAVSADELLG